MSSPRISAALEASNRKYDEYLKQEIRRKAELKKVAEENDAKEKAAVVAPVVDAAPIASNSSWTSIFSYLPLVGSYFVDSPAPEPMKPSI